MHPALRELPALRVLLEPRVLPRRRLLRVMLPALLSPPTLALLRPCWHRSWSVCSAVHACSPSVKEEQGDGDTHTAPVKKEEIDASTDAVLCDPRLIASRPAQGPSSAWLAQVTAPYLETIRGREVNKPEYLFLDLNSFLFFFLK